MGYMDRLRRKGIKDPVTGCLTNTQREHVPPVSVAPVSNGKRYWDTYSSLLEMTPAQVANYLKACELNEPIADDAAGYYWSNTGQELTPKQVDYFTSYESEHYCSPFPPSDPRGQAVLIINESPGGKIQWDSFSDWFADEIIEFNVDGTCSHPRHPTQLKKRDEAHAKIS